MKNIAININKKVYSKFVNKVNAGQLTDFIERKGIFGCMSVNPFCIFLTKIGRRTFFDTCFFLSSSKMS